MSTAYDILAENEWAPKLANTKALDFARVKFGKHKKVSAKTARPVWTVKHMECLFTAPIWTGGGGHLKRLDENAGSEVYHDAAYWLPLLLYYTHATVNEVGGLRTDEVHIDDVTPSIVIKDNDVRAEDGVDGGEKNESRGRMVPLHPEIMQLSGGTRGLARPFNGRRDSDEAAGKARRAGAHRCAAATVRGAQGTERPQDGHTRLRR